MKRFLFIIIALLSLTACHESQFMNAEDQISKFDFNIYESDDETAPIVTIESLTLTNGTNLEIPSGTTTRLFTKVHLSNGKTYHNITKQFHSIYSHLNGYLLWYSNDSNIVQVSDDGLLTAIGEGETTVLVSLQNKTAVLYVSVLPQNADAIDYNYDYESDYENVENNNAPPSEPGQDEDTVPIPILDLFLNSKDIFTFDGGLHNTFDSPKFPTVFYGDPGGTTDIVSFGIGGELKIELNDVVIENGNGDDFTIFENPFYINNDPEFGGFFECATVSVSEDDQIYYTFNCQQYDQENIHTGCAGKTPVNIGLPTEDYLDPSLSGGDAFDLNDLPGQPHLNYVKFIKIKDIGLCQKPDDPPYDGFLNGFDLDALAIIHGLTE